MHLTDEQRTAHKIQMFGLWLETAVPVWLLRMRAEGWSPSERLERAQVASKLLAEKSDLLIRSPTKPKHSEQRAELLNRLAEGVACMAFCPGGVTLFGKKFEVSGDSTEIAPPPSPPPPAPKPPKLPKPRRKASP